MKKKLTKKDYDNYMKIVNHNIKDLESRLDTIDKLKKVSRLSFDDWVNFQNGMGLDFSNEPYYASSRSGNKPSNPSKWFEIFKK